MQKQPTNLRVDTDRHSFILDIEKPEIPLRVSHRAEELGLIMKPEFHISILVNRNAQLLNRVLEQQQNPEVALNSLIETFHKTDWSYEMTNVFVLHEQHYSLESLSENYGKTNFPAHTRRSIVQVVEVPSLSKWYDSVSGTLNEVFPEPVPHVTLFTWSDYEPMMARGIGISSKEEFDQCTKEIL